MECYDPYNRAFSDSIDGIEKLGTKLGNVINKISKHTILTVLTSLAIVIFGTFCFITSFKNGLFKPILKK